MTQRALRMGVEVLEVAEGIAEEIDGVVQVVVVGHRATEWREETLCRIGLRVVRRGWDQTELFCVAIHSLPNQLGPLGRVDLGVVEQDDRRSASCLGTLDKWSSLPS